MDTLRGFALLGILAMNIVAFALPSAAYMNADSPALAPYQGEFTGLNRITWYITTIFFDLKMMAIFSMLFGAGLTLMDARSATPLAARYYRRLLVLLGIGLAHAYLLWYGDILTSYAICGAFLYPVRRARPAWLIGLACTLLVIPIVVSGSMGAGLLFLEHQAQLAQQALDAGQTLSAHQQEMLDTYRNVNAGMNPSSAAVAADVEAVRSGFLSALRVNAVEALMLQTTMFAMWTFWRALALMLIGVALMKTGVFAGTRAPRFYTRMALIGFALGLPLCALGAFLHTRHHFHMGWMFLLDWHFNYVGSIGMALGYVGVIMRLYQWDAFPALRARLAAVGRMALTNYLMHSVVMTAIFYGWGLGYYGHFERYQLTLFVVGMWAVQLIMSPIWLSRFRFGPAEWVWRTLTYGRAQRLFR